MTLSVGADRSADHDPCGGFDVRTARCDATRANLYVSGDLNADGAVLLGEVLDGHIRAGRRFLRLHVGRLRSLSDAALEVIASAHDRLLAHRGTLVLTGVSEHMQTRLRAAAPASPLLVLPAAADERV